MSTFPFRPDQFPEALSIATINASVANNYTAALVAVQSNMDALVKRRSLPGQKLTGFCWRVQINNTMPNDNGGDGDRQIDKYGPLSYRYQRNPNADNWPDGREPVDTQIKDSGSGFNYDRQGTMGSCIPPVSLVTLPIPGSASGVMPNSVPFHVKNGIFITYEAQQKSSQDNIGDESWWNNDDGRKNVGGFNSRDGLLYYDTVDDYNPQLVVSDWTPQHFGTDDKLPRLGDIFTVFIHMVIIG